MLFVSLNALPIPSLGRLTVKISFTAPSLPLEALLNSLRYSLIILLCIVLFTLSQNTLGLSQRVIVSLFVYMSV